MNTPLAISVVRAPRRAWQEKLALRDALAGWREKLLARGALEGDAHYTAIERHAHIVWDARESQPTVRIPAAQCPRCSARKPLDGPCVSCERVRV